MDTVKLKAIVETTLIAGVDEAGRGPLAGPVVASAVILDPSNPIEGLDDSKKLSELQRDKLAVVIRERAIAWAVAYSDVEEIDRINILQATLVAMLRAVSRLKVQPAHIQVDGNKLPDIAGLPFPCTAEAIVEGDALIPAISAASILAKTSRDAMMMKLDEQHPGYGFAIHKGYGTAMHLRALRELGACAIHRRTFAPVKAVLVGEVVE